MLIFDLFILYLLATIFFLLVFSFYSSIRKYFEILYDENCFGLSTLFDYSRNVYRNSNDQLNKWIKKLSYKCFQNIRFDPFRYWSYCDHYFDFDAKNSKDYSDDQNIKLEINKLSEVICVNFIDFWYDCIQSSLPREGENFRKLIKKNLNEAIYNFYLLTQQKLCNDSSFAIQIFDKLNDCLKKRRHYRHHKDFDDIEQQIFSQVLDDILIRVLPKDVNSLITKCDDGHNSVRLFVYNILIYTIILPSIQKITDPFFILYNYLYLCSTCFGTMSLEDFVFRLENKSRSSNLDSTDNPDQDFRQDETVDLLHNEQSSSPNDWSKGFFNEIRIIQAKISTSNPFTNNNMNKSEKSKVDPYIDYIIVYNVLVIDDKHPDCQSRWQSYQVSRRFSEFLSFQYRLEKHPEYRKYMVRLKRKPSSIYFHPNSLFSHLIPKTSFRNSLNANSTFVQQRREHLSDFLNELARVKVINESKEFCEFLGYKYKTLIEAKQLLVKGLLNEERTEGKKKISKLSLLNLNRMKGYFDIFLPVKAKFGQLATQIENLYVNHQTLNKFSITPIEFDDPMANEMILKNNLEIWRKTQQPSDHDDDQHSNKEYCDPIRKEIKPDEYLPLYQRITNTIILLIFRNDRFISLQFLVNKISWFLMVWYAKLQNNFRYNEFFRSYIHSLHRYINGDCVQPSNLMTYERFVEFFKDSTNAKEILQKYIDLNKEQYATHYQQKIENGRIYYKLIQFALNTTFIVIDYHANNLMTAFNNQKYNRFIVMNLAKVFRDKISV
ncbi:LOW QUALITY PROTEIN: uncharacterized protein LOC113793509 [Dermatophagoides pteronyssinus]|uniref:LOW QUALITY PROTEIN: uncharacterized protein LOC113793509 n=1 Tax=Dermatophagoides pteronyssinus TaxID=6956 RepID=UPI003F6773AB